MKTKRKKACWCSIRFVKSGPDKGSIGDMICSHSKRTVRDTARYVVTRGLDINMTKPRIKKAPRAYC